MHILVFIDRVHTPKNILIRAVKKGTATGSGGYRKVMEFLHVTPMLAVLQDGKGEGRDV